MAPLALAIFALWMITAFGVRTFLQMRRTGDSGWRGFSGRPGSIEWWAGLLFVLALVGGLMAPLLELFGANPISELDRPAVAVVGTTLAISGVVLTFLAQLEMGESWRIGVAEDESTDLVVRGAFRLVRNPIFSAMSLTAVGLALMVPNAVALLSLAALFLALELQVRLVEEPYLRQAHGATYDRYASSVGRFVPGVGRIGTE